MNAFADILFSALLSWLRGILEGIFNFFSGESSGTFVTWIGTNWFPLLLFLCAAGVFLDGISRLARRSREKLIREKENGGLADAQNQMDRELFIRGYNDAVLPYEGEDRETVWAEKTPEREINISGNGSGLEEDESGYSLPQSAAYSPEWDRTASEVPVRHRRQDKKENRKKGFFHQVNTLLSSDDDQQVIDGLPPIRDKREAFREAVYPERKEPYQ